MGFFSNLFKKKEKPQPAAKVSFVEKKDLHPMTRRSLPSRETMLKPFSFGHIVKHLPLKEA